MSALELASVPSLPVGFEVIGRVEAKCSQWQPGTDVDSLWLSDLDCSSGRLRRALVEKAAAVGGEVVVNQRCGSTSGRWQNHRDSGRSALYCRAEVARPELESASERPLNPELKGRGASLAAGRREAAFLDDPTGGQAWRIKVSYHPETQPVSALPVGPARPARAVNELSALPPFHERAGALTSACAADCSLDAMRASLRVAAGRLGIEDVVGVRCIPESSGWRCVGTLAVSEVSP